MPSGWRSRIWTSLNDTDSGTRRGSAAAVAPQPLPNPPHHRAFEDDRLVGACCVGRTDHVGVIRWLIQTRASVGAWKARLCDDPNRFMEAYVACSQV